MLLGMDSAAMTQDNGAALTADVIVARKTLMDSMEDSVNEIAEELHDARACEVVEHRGDPGSRWCSGRRGRA